MTLARPSRERRLAVLTLAGFLLPACTPTSQASAERPARTAESPKDVVAEMGGIKITREELDRRVADRLSALRQQEYEIRRRALEEMLADRLVDREAAARGQTPEEFLKEQLEGRTPTPGQQEIERIYEQNKARWGARSREDALRDIREALRGRLLSQQREALRRDLLARPDVRILLEPPRVAVPFPAGAPTLGPAEAPVTIVEFSDYQCPYCVRAEPTVQQVLRQYQNKVRLVHRDFPLDGHPRAFPTSRAAHCAGEQGRFWEYHRDVLSKPSTLGDDDLKARAAALGLDAAAFSRCLVSERHDGAIRASLDEGSRLGVSGTPTFFINGRMVVGARPFEEFRAVIDEELARGR